MSVSTVIRAQGLGVSLAGRRVLHGVDIDVEAGEFIVLLGGNGSGKTTLVRALLGLVARTGSVELLGDPLDRFSEWHKIGYVPQRLTLPTAMPATVSEVVLSGRIAHSGLWRGYSKADRAAATQALDVVDLAELAEERVSRLSGGQQQRVLIARALATEPEIILLDEPVSHVDVEHQTQFARLLRDAHAQGATVLLVAHALGKMSGLASRTIVLDEGRVVYDGPPHESDVHDDEVHHHAPGYSTRLRPIGGDR
jgi:zinc transport system ATP-binding protein